MRFHLDENVTSAVGRGLRERGLDVTTTPASGLLSATDPAQFAFAKGERRVLVSDDTDVLRLAADATAAGVSFAGIAYCDKQKYPTGKLIERLLRLAAGVSDAETQNRIEFSDGDVAATFAVRERPALSAEATQLFSMKPLKTYLRRMAPKAHCPPRKPVKKIVWSTIGAFVGIYLIALASRYAMSLGLADQMFLIGSFGASAVLTYGAPLAEFSQPRNLVLGHLVSAIVGVTAFKLMPNVEVVAIASATAVAFAIAAMHLTRSLHPPGGATALIAVIGTDRVHQLGYEYVVAPVLIGATILLIVALAINNLSTNPKRHYPVYWF